MEKPIVSLEQWWRMMKEAGLPFKALQWPINDPDFRARLVEFWMAGGKLSEPTIFQSTSLKRAQDILGNNMILPKDVEKHLGVQYSEKDLEQLSQIPWDEKTLEEVKDTHVLVPGYPLSILEIRDKAPKKTFYSYDDAWYNNQSFATKDKVQLRWYLIRKDVVPGSIGRPYQERIGLLGKNEEVPTAVEAVYAMAIYYLKNNIKLFSTYWAMTRDLDSGGGRVYVFSYFGELLVGCYCWDDDHDGGLGVAASRLPSVALA